MRNLIGKATPKEYAELNASLIAALLRFVSTIGARFAPLQSIGRLNLAVPPNHIFLELAHQTFSVSRIWTFSPREMPSVLDASELTSRQRNDESPWSLFNHPDGESFMPHSENIIFTSGQSRARALRKKQGVELESTSPNRSDAKLDEGTDFQTSCRTQKTFTGFRPTHSSVPAVASLSSFPSSPSPRSSDGFSIISINKTHGLLQATTSILIPLLPRTSTLSRSFHARAVSEFEPARSSPHEFR